MRSVEPSAFSKENLTAIPDQQVISNGAQFGDPDKDSSSTPSSWQVGQ